VRRRACLRLHRQGRGELAHLPLKLRDALLVLKERLDPLRHELHLLRVLHHELRFEQELVHLRRGLLLP